MTAVTPYQVMIAITVNTAIGTIVRRAAHIAECVIPLSVSAVLMNVPHVTSRFAGSVPFNAKSVKTLTVKIVSLTMEFAMTV